MKTKFVGAAMALTAVVALPVAGSASGHGDRDDEPRLLGRAVLPFDTLAPGPPVAAVGVTDPTGNVTFPLASQPVVGFSGIVEGDRPGQYLAISDNGFGNQANSADFLLRAYVLEPDFKTADGGSGAVTVRDWIQFRDPYDLLDFPIKNEGQIGRLLTGRDVDPESIQRDRNGDLWVGDEFGPWILHFSADGVLLDAPYSIPGVIAATNPAIGAQTPTIGNSRGFEALAISGRNLYGILEGAVVGDPADTRRVYEFDTREGSSPDARGRTGRSRRQPHPGAPAAGAALVADAQALNRHQLVVIERDGSRDTAALTGFKRVYVIDLRKSGPDGTVVKDELLNMVDIPDPDGVAQPPIRSGDIGLGNPPPGRRSRWSASRSRRCARSATASSCSAATTTCRTPAATRPSPTTTSSSSSTCRRLLVAAALADLHRRSVVWYRPDPADVQTTVRRFSRRTGRPEGVEGDGERGREVLAELGVVLADLRDGVAPAGGVDRQQLVEVVVGDLQALGVECLGRRQQADRRLDRVGVAVDPLEDPLQHPAVLTEPGPQEAPVVVAAEPVDEEDAGQLRRVGGLADRQPVGEVVGEVVAAERQHRHRVEAQLADRALLGGRRLRRHDRAEEHAVLPVVGLGDERDRRAPAAAEHDRRDRHAVGVLPLGGDRRALRGRRREAGVGVGGRGLDLRVPRRCPSSRWPGPAVGSCPPTTRRRRRSSAVLVKMQLPHSVSMALGLVS